MNAVLFIFSGLPAVGKSTIARYVAKKHKAVYLRIDTIEQGLRDLCNVKVHGEGYRLAYRVATENLNLGINVVADSCNPIDLTRNEWEEIALRNDGRFVNIEIVCTDKVEHKRRVETRSCEIENLKLPEWKEVENREYHPWKKERIVVDTANRSIEVCVKELFKKIELCLNPIC